MLRFLNRNLKLCASNCPVGVLVKFNYSTENLYKKIQGVFNNFKVKLTNTVRCCFVISLFTLTRKTSPIVYTFSTRNISTATVVY